MTSVAELPAQGKVSRIKIERLERFILQLPQVDLSTKNYLHGGMYAREVFIPAGTVLTGSAHNFDHINVCDGEIVVWTEDGMKILKGHHTLTSRKGAKRAGLALQDTYWTTFHATDKTDIREIEDEVFAEAEWLQTRVMCLPSEAQPLLEV